eukprot:344306-Prorocentrum_minimum.AAC.2
MLMEAVDVKNVMSVSGLNQWRDGNAKRVRKSIVLEGRALMCMGPDNAFRMKVAEMVHHKRFETIIIVLICLSSIILAIDSPNIDQVVRENSFSVAIIPNNRFGGAAAQGARHSRQALRRHLRHRVRDEGSPPGR